MKKITVIVLWFTLTGLFAGCGAVEKLQAEENLQVHLQIPEGEEEEEFWSDVSNRKLRILGEEEQEFEWTAGTKVELDIQAGDQLEFLGFDDGGNVVVSGRAEVGEQKRVTIPVTKVL